MVGGRPVFLLVVWSQDVSPRGPFQAVTLMSVQREKLLQLFSMVNGQASKLTEVGFKSFLFNSYKKQVEREKTIFPSDSNQKNKEHLTRALVSIWCQKCTLTSNISNNMFINSHTSERLQKPLFLWLKLE